MDGIDLQSLSIIIAATSVVIGVAYNVYNIRLQNKSRQAQVYLGLWPRLNSTEMMNAHNLLYHTEVKSIDEFVKLLSDQAWSNAFFYVFKTFETVGVFVHEDLLNIRLFARDTAGPFMRFWMKYNVYIKEYRTINNQPRWFIEAEMLYDKMMEFAKKNPDFQIKIDY